MAPRRIFLCYRRADTPHVAGRLYDRLAARYGSSNVFMDVDSIEPGLDFTDVIERALDECAVLLALIGGSWLGDLRGDGRSRLDDAADVVRFEIVSALRRGVRVIPVLVDGAEMPPAWRIPSDLAPLARRNAVRLDHETFRTDVGPLIDAVGQALAGHEKRPRSATKTVTTASTATPPRNATTPRNTAAGIGAVPAASSSGRLVPRKRGRRSRWRMLVGAASVAPLALSSLLLVPDVSLPGTNTTPPTTSTPTPVPAPSSDVPPIDEQGGQVIGGTLTEDEQAMIALMSPEDRARYLLAKRIDDKAEMAVLLSQLQSERHETGMSVINNIR